MEEPILFISSPPFYFTEVEELKASYLEESTSVFVPNRSERIIDQLVARQLNYFAQPVNQSRTLVFHLLNGDKIIGSVLGVEGNSVAIKSADQVIPINANDIKRLSIATAMSD